MKLFLNLIMADHGTCKAPETSVSLKKQITRSKKKNSFIYYILSNFLQHSKVRSSAMKAEQEALSHDSVIINCSANFQGAKCKQKTITILNSFPVYSSEISCQMQSSVVPLYVWFKV